MIDRKKIGENPVSKVMRKRFKSVTPSEPIKTFIKEFQKADVNVIPVISKGKFLGEVHELDLLKLIVDPTHIPNEEVISLGFDVDFGYFAKTAKDIMRRHDLSVKPTDLLQDAAYTMRREDASALPVKEKGKIIGMLTANRILNLIIKNHNKK
ncbi:MAG: CBS domain-containing protein [Candidatus Diapherotrites archaeon]|nr:CBS domain-containing protein [Candidatus Diapherotrites archaeon]